jgi:multidrug transporter EmrE-like cation transporter
MRNKTTCALWTQGLLALIFLFAGGIKLAMPAEELAAAMAALPLPIAFVRFIAVCEVLGALGLVLPGVVRIRTELTPLAAAGLVVIMVGAVTTTLATMDASMAVLPLVVGVLAATVAYGRARVAPLANGHARGVALRPAI